MKAFKLFALAVCSLVLADMAVYSAWPLFSSNYFASASIPEILHHMEDYSLGLITAPETIPASEREDVFVIGVFGGSVASTVAIDLDFDKWKTVPSAVELSRKLGKPLRFENVAMHCGSQPAQYNLTRMFHDRIHAAVFLDGFNEIHTGSPIADGATGCKALESFWQKNTLTTQELLRPLMEQRTNLSRIARSWAMTPLRFSGLFRLYLYKLSVDMRSDVDLYLRTLTEEDHPIVHLSDEGIAADWATCIALSNDYAVSVGLPIVFFLQPNQYVPDSKVFTPEEQETAFGGMKGKEVARKYAHMNAQVERLSAQGVPVTSLTDVYRDVRETIYIDSCCHTNARGSLLMAEVIAAKLLERIPDTQEAALPTP